MIMNWVLGLELWIDFGLWNRLDKTLANVLRRFSNYLYLYQGKDLTRQSKAIW